MKIWVYLTFFGLLSCAKEPASIGNDQILGQWLQTSKNQVEARYVNASRFGEFDYGLIFFDNGQYIERSESGICIGESCLTENFNGSYRWLDDKTLELKVENYHGLSLSRHVVSFPEEGSMHLAKQP